MPNGDNRPGNTSQGHTIVESVFASDSSITLNVKTLESQTYSVAVSVGETVRQLKERLATLLEVPTPRQRLIFRGRVLADEKALTEYYAPRTTTGSAAGSGPPRHEHRDYHFSIIGIDDDADPQDIMQALAGALPPNVDLEGPPSVFQIDGDPSVLRSILSAAGATADNTRAPRMRAMPNTHRHVPLGASLPHLATIEAELTRAAAQLRNVHTILAHPADQLEGVELEPLDIPELETIDESIDGDSADLGRMGSILTQLSETSRAMANHLQTLSNQFNQTLGHPSERLSLQRVSLRAARAMYRLASVQNTVFPMLANATFVGTTPGPVTYRYQPAARLNTTQQGNTSRSNGRRAPGVPRATIFHGFPFQNIPRGTGAGTAAAPLGLIPSVMAHARASAQNYMAAVAAASAGAPEGGSTNTMPSSTSAARAQSGTSAASVSNPTAPSATPQLGSDPIGQMVLGPNGSLSYSIQSPLRTSSRGMGGPPSYAAAAAAATAAGAANPFASSNQDQVSFSRFAVPADLSGTGFMDFLRAISGQISPPTNSSNTSNSSHSSTGASATVASTTPGGVPSTTRRTGQETGDHIDQLDQALTASLLSRRRERPEEFNQDTEERAAIRRRLSNQLSSAAADLESRIQQELEQLYASGRTGTAAAAPSAPAINNNATPSRILQASRAIITRSSSNDTRRSQAPGNTADSSSTASSPSPSSPPMPSVSGSNSNNSQTAPSAAYNLGRIGVFISAILRMVDQPREDGSPRTLADVICNDPQSSDTTLQNLVRSVAESITVRETRLIVEGHPAAMRNIQPVLNSFIRERALHGQQLTESNLDSVALMFAQAIMNAVHVEEILETLSPSASIQITSTDIRRISMDVLREHFRRLLYLVVAAPSGRESNWPTFARDLVLWIRDVVGAWRVGFYGLFPERDQAEAQRIATHVVGSAIHANGRRWVELSNRATNTLVNVLCANIVPRRRGEEQPGLVGGAWPLMATGPQQNSSRSRTCMAPSLLGSTAPPAPLGPQTVSSNTHAGSLSTASSRNASHQPFAAEAETLSDNLTRRIQEMMAPLGINMAGNEELAASMIRGAIRAELLAMRSSGMTPSTATTASTADPVAVNGSNSSSSATTGSSSVSDSKAEPSCLRTRVEDAEDEDL
ncbi:hypothetical protein BG011_002846 [Mortierella polycephala]|uniref:Ubiquitin-like domain-containing protein n=1 Tax=Mortierella polycephala TaxID=41804 RepID=A0A9P6Q4Z0_9FUNG|nr:hypothetical protein BG011_002846 [Mortierella polycephala]